MADNLETELARLIREEVRRQLAESGVAVKDAGPAAGAAKLLGSPETKAFLLGATVALAAAALWPSVKPALKPALASAMQGLTDFSDKVRTGFAEAQESLSDLVAEARFEKEQAEKGLAAPGPEIPKE
jgi:replication-associated recombination protein RarA